MTKLGGTKEETQVFEDKPTVVVGRKGSVHEMPAMKKRVYAWLEYNEQGLEKTIIEEWERMSVVEKNEMRKKLVKKALKEAKDLNQSEIDTLSTEIVRKSCGRSALTFQSTKHSSSSTWLIEIPKKEKGEKNNKKKTSFSLFVSQENLRMG